MSDGQRYELVLTPPAVRAIQGQLPEAVAAAVIEFLTGPRVAAPARVGKPLRGELTGIHSARRGTYRVLYRTEMPDGTPRVSGAMLFVPTGPAPAGGRKVIAWAHPTVGMGDSCAPSRSTQPTQNMDWLQGMLDRGWIVTATDYAGLGTDGIEYYLIGENEAIDTINWECQKVGVTGVV